MRRMTPESSISATKKFSAFFADDQRKWARVIKADNIRLSE
jgi:hypothetical protein